MGARITTPSAAAEKQRLDKWLWFARVVKTRRQAVELIESGYVRVDAQRVEVPAKPVGPGMVLTIALDRRVRILKITAIAPRRGSADVAAHLFEDLAANGSAAKATPAAI